MLTATNTIEILQRLKNLAFLQEIEVIEQPYDVEADLSLRLHASPFLDQYRNVVIDTIVDWEMEELERTGEMPGIYWEWADSPLVA
jgi:hypothetical protein